MFLFTYSKFHLIFSKEIVLLLLHDTCYPQCNPGDWEYAAVQFSDRWDVVCLIITLSSVEVIYL